MKIDRKLFLRELEMVSVGLSKQDVIEQSSCFAFKDGLVVTFNDEVAARMPSQLKIDGAVQAEPLLSLLRKLKEDEVDIEVTEEGLRVKGKGRQAVICMQKKILLSIDDIESPGKWKKIPDGLMDALKMASSCCSRSETVFVLMCVCVNKDRVDSSDDFQVFSYAIETGVKKPVLLRRDSVAKLSVIDPTKFSQSDKWIHFQNSGGLVMSCRSYEDEYPDVRKHLKVEGSATVLPKNIDDILDKAQIFSTDDRGSNQVKISLSPGKLSLKGEGPLGWYEERRKIDYSGELLEFCIEPRLLMEISRRSDSCIIGEGRIKVVADKFSYVVCTAIPGE